MATYKTNVGIDYLREEDDSPVHIDEGTITDKIPTDAVKWLLDNGAIEEYDPDAEKAEALRIVAEAKKTEVLAERPEKKENK